MPPKFSSYRVLQKADYCRAMNTQKHGSQSRGRLRSDSLMHYGFAPHS